MAQDGAEPDFSVSKLIAWCSSNMSKSELAALSASLQEVAELSDEDHAADGPPDWKSAPIPGTMRRVGEDLRLGSRRASDAAYHARFPNAARIKSV